MALVARAAAALPSGRRLGSGRLPLAALPGHGAFVLAVRRDGTGRGGILAVEFKVLSPRTAWAVKATNAESDHPTEGADSEEFELVRELKAILDPYIKGPRSVKIRLFDVDDLRHKFYQGMLEKCATSSFELWANVANRFRPATESKLYEGLRLCGETLVSAAARSSKQEATWKNFSDTVEALELLRRLVSSTQEAPLPQDWSLRWDASVSEDYDDAERGLFSVMHRTQVLVERDIKAMLGDVN